MRALVTGSAGFIGRHFAATLERGGYDVDHYDPAHPEPRYQHDCRVLPIVTYLDRPAPKYDLVIHAAAMVDGREAIEGKPALLGARNLQLDGAMFEWALRWRPAHLVYFSSSAAYPVSLQNTPRNRGRLREDAVSDDVIGLPDATYGWVKLTGERMAAELRRAGVPVTIVRPFSGYGSDQAECYPFPAMIARASRGDDPFDVWGDGAQVRDFIHVYDIVAAVLTLIDAAVDGPVNLGTGRATSMDDLARIAMHAAGYDAPIRHLSDKPAGVQHRVADTTLLSRYYSPKITLEEGVATALETLRESKAA